MKSTNASSVQYITIDDTRIGQRLDNFLQAHFRKLPRSRIYRAIRGGEVRVNGGRKRPDYRLVAEDCVRVPPLQVATTQRPTHIGPALEQTLRAAILYEDDTVLVLNKPAGLAVHGGSGVTIGVIEALRILFDNMHLELAHRLDRETSGCLLVAKNRQVLTYLQGLWRENRIEKKYNLLVSRRWQGGERRIELPLSRDVCISGERMVTVDFEKGKSAITDFRPLTYFDEATLLEATLITGRTHQIRVHVRYLGHPIIGDQKYGDKAINQRMAKKGHTRLFLHAASLQYYPQDETHLLSVEAPLPDAFTQLFEAL